MRKPILWFTLVELIVVITIVGILSTVGFVSYSWYLTWARDSNRYSQLTKLSDSLQTYAATKSLPLPDDYIEITSSGSENTIAYQGYVWNDVLETIDYTNGWKDPKDDSYFTYYLTKDRKKLQLLALMEEEIVRSSLTNNSYAVDYENRSPVVYWNKLWVLVSSEEASYNLPAQEVSWNKTNGYLDIIHTPNNYKTFIGDTPSEWTWALIGLEIITQGKLLWKWSFDETSGTSVKNTAANTWNWTLSWSINANHIAWRKWNALDFLANVNDDDVWSNIYFADSFDFGWDATYSFSFWINPDNPSWANYRFSIPFKTLHSWGGNFFEFAWQHKTTSLRQACSSIRKSGRQEVQIQGEVPINQWTHVTCVFWDNYMAVYVNGEENNKLSSNAIAIKRQYQYTQLLIWSWNETAWYFDGKLDEVYLFNKALSPEEVKIIYSLSQ